MPRKLTPSDQNKESRLVASEMGARLWRMQVGLAWASNDVIESDRPITVTLYPGDRLLRQARPVKSGTPGMSDNGGFVLVEITPEMVGSKFPMTLWVEDKSGKSRPTTDQRNFITMIRRMGGRAGVARGPDDVRAIIRGEILD